MAFNVTVTPQWFPKHNAAWWAKKRKLLGEQTGVEWNFWLHAMCEWAEWYSTYQIPWENWWL